MSHEIEPIMPPEGEGHGRRYESANLNMGELKEYLLDTAFEDESALVEELSNRYGMARREGEQDIQINMTREYKSEGVDTIQTQFPEDEIIAENNGQPLSGEEPKEVLSLFLSTTDGNEFTLRIYEVLNRNKAIRFEYILE